MMHKKSAKSRKLKQDSFEILIRKSIKYPKLSFQPFLWFFLDRTIWKKSRHYQFYWVCILRRTPRVYKQGLREKFCQGVRRSVPGALASADLVETCMTCLCSNKNINIDKIAPMLIFTYSLIVILATGLE